jgi:hypothetical protein
MEFDDTFISPEVRAIELEELDEVGPGISAMRRDELVGLVKDGVLHDDVCVCGCVCVWEGQQEIVHYGFRSPVWKCPVARSKFQRTASFPSGFPGVWEASTAEFW